MVGHGPQLIRNLFQIIEILQVFPLRIQVTISQLAWYEEAVFV